MLVLFSFIIYTEWFGGLHGPVSRLENQFYSTACSNILIDTIFCRCIGKTDTVRNSVVGFYLERAQI